MMTFKKSGTALSALVLFQLAPALLVGSEPPVTTKLSPGTELILVDASSTSRSARFVRAEEGMLRLRTFDSSKDRFREEEIPLQDLSELRIVERHRSALYPIVGSLLLGGVGAVVGYNLGDDGHYGGDVEEEDTRGVAALGLGLAGFAVGFIGGAILAPETRTETIVWKQ